MRRKRGRPRARPRMISWCLLPIFLSEVFVPGSSLAAFEHARKADFWGIRIAALMARATGWRKLRKIFAIYRLERLGLIELLQRARERVDQRGRNARLAEAEINSVVDHAAGQ